MPSKGFYSNLFAAHAVIHRVCLQVKMVSFLQSQNQAWQLQKSNDCQHGAQRSALKTQSGQIRQDNLGVSAAWQESIMLLW